MLRRPANPVWTPRLVDAVFALGRRMERGVSNSHCVLPGKARSALCRSLPRNLSHACACVVVVASLSLLIERNTL